MSQAMVTCSLDHALGVTKPPKLSPPILGKFGLTILGAIGSPSLAHQLGCWQAQNTTNVSSLVDVLGCSRKTIITYALSTEKGQRNQESLDLVQWADRNDVFQGRPML